MNAGAFTLLSLADLQSAVLASGGGLPAIPGSGQGSGAAGPLAPGQTPADALRDATQQAYKQAQEGHAFLTDPLGYIAGWFSARWEEFKPALRRFGWNWLLVCVILGCVGLFIFTSDPVVSVAKDVAGTVIGTKRAAVVAAGVKKLGG